MRNTITRTIVETTIHGCTIGFEKGMPVANDIEPVKVFGIVDDAKAQKILKKVCGKDSAVHVREITSEEVEYEISVEDFIKYATRVEKNAN